jgi:hypothetical protein
MLPAAFEVGGSFGVVESAVMRDRSRCVCLIISIIDFFLSQLNVGVDLRRTKK